MSELAGQKVVFLRGTDEFAIENWVKKVYRSIPDATTAQMIFSRMDLIGTDVNRVKEEAYAIPFMAPERYVVLDNVLYPFSGNAGKETLRRWQEEFLAFLDHLPSQTKLILIQKEREYKPKDYEKQIWLMEWGSKNDAALKAELLLVPSDPQDRERWIMAEAKRQGVTLERDAVILLNRFAGDFDPRILAQEIAKLAAFANYSRPITAKDVLEVGVSDEHAGIFDLVDAIGNKNTTIAINKYRKLLDDKDPLEIFPMIVRQFRLIIQTKYALEHNYPVSKISGMASDYVSRKILPQCKNFNSPQLKNYYQALLEMEVTTKSTAVSLEAAIEIFILRSCAGANFPKNFLFEPPLNKRRG